MKRVLLWLLTLVCLAGVAQAKTVYFVNGAPFDNFDCWLWYNGQDGDWASEIQWDGEECLQKLDYQIAGKEVYKVVTDRDKAKPARKFWAEGQESQEFDLAEIDGKAIYIKGIGVGNTEWYDSLDALILAKDPGAGSNEPATLVRYDDLQIRGAFEGNWGAMDSHRFNVTSSDDSKIVYEWTGKVAAGQDFKFGDGEWAIALATPAPHTITYFGAYDLEDVTNGGAGGNMRIENLGDFDGTIVITQELKDGKINWTVDFKNGTVVNPDPTPSELLGYTIYTRGDVNGEGRWTFSDDLAMTRKDIKEGDDLVGYSYEWIGNVKANGKVNFGAKENDQFYLGSDLENEGDKPIAAATGTEKLIEHDRYNFLFGWDSETKVKFTVKQTVADGWSFSWQALEEVVPVIPEYSEGLEHSLNRYDLHMRADVGTIDGDSWDGYWDGYENRVNDRRKMHRVKVVNKEVNGYTYTWQGTLTDGVFNFGDFSGFRLGFEEMPVELEDHTYTGNDLGRKMNWYIGNDADNHDIRFPWLAEYDVKPEIRITLTQVRDEETLPVGTWYMKWEEVARPENVEAEGGVYLHSSEFNEWDQSKRRAFKWNEKDGRYELALNFENSSIDVVHADGSTTSMTSTTLTNFFYIEAFGETYSIEGGIANPIPTDTRVTLGNNFGVLGPNEGQDKARLPRNMILEDQALEDAVLYYNPTTHQFRVTGKKSSNIDAGKYTIYYKLTKDDLNPDGTQKNIYLWAWGNSDTDRDVLSTGDFEGMNSDSWPGIRLDQKGKLVNVEEEDENGVKHTVSYIEYELDIPAGNSTIGLIFSHDGEQTKNYLDTEFQNGRIYQWNAVIENSIEEFFAKVALRVVDNKGNKALLLMETEDGEHYTLKNIDMNNFAKSAATDRYMQDFKEGVRLGDEELIRAEQANDGDIKAYVGFYVVRTRNSNEWDDLLNGSTAPSIRDYRYYYTNNGGLAYWKTYDLDRTEGQMDHVAWNGNEWVYGNPTGDKLTHDKMMTLNSEDVDGLTFRFELSNGNLTVERDKEHETTERIVIYFHNVNNMKAPHILVESEKTGIVYTANNKVVKDGQVIELGEAMLHDDSRLNVDPTLWRYELRVPLHELNGTGIHSKDNWKDGIKPHNYEAASNLHFTFTDAAAPVAPQHNGKFLGSTVKKAAATEADDMNNVNQLLNVPVVHGGVYSLANDPVPGETVGYIYLVNSSDNKIIGKLEQTASPDYIFESTLNLEDMGLTDDTLSVYVATSTSEDGVSADGVYYGAGSKPNDEVAQDMIADTAKHSAEYAMTYNNSNPYVINLNELNDLKDKGYDGKLAVKVEVNPTNHTGDIGFGINAQDIETGIGEVEDADAPVLWFNLQGVRLEAPVKGVNIRVQGRKSTKVFVTE